MTADARVLRGIDRAAFAAALVMRLRRAGVAVDASSAQAFARGLDACPPVSRTVLYWVARVTLVHRPEDLVAFDAVFALAFSPGALAVDPPARKATGVPAPATDAAAPAGRRGAPGVAAAPADLPWAAPAPVAVAAPAGEEVLRPVAERRPSATEGLEGVPFDALSSGDLARLDRWFASVLRSWPTRRSRRMAPHHAGRRVNLRATLARARRTGFDVADLVMVRPVRRPRRLVMVCDVSQSMQPYATAYLHLLRAAVVAADAEVFAFATSLTRLTPVLAHASAEVAVERATEEVVDRFGGTRIAANLRTLLASQHGETCRGAIVVVASDGWDSDPPEAMAAAMARLRRRAHRVVWLNPRLAAPGYVPLVGGMAAALPYCDEVLPADTVEGLADVVEALGRP